MSSSLPNLAAEPLRDLATYAVREFQARYRRSPSVIVAAPGRVNLIGEHIDYNDGYVLPMAIERYVVIAASPIDGHDRQTAKFYSTNLQEAAVIPLGSKIEPALNGWINYIAGVLAEFVDRGVRIASFDAVVHSNVPLGGGLSSSAALEVATATLLETITSTPLAKHEKALICQRAEHRFAGMPCGIMDQFSSVFGKPGELMLIDCRSQEIQPVAFDAEDVTVVITNSNVKHELAAGQYADRRSQCESALRKLKQSSWRDVTPERLARAETLMSPVEYRRARHVVTEIYRTIEVATAFRAGGNWTLIGELMYASHASLRDDFAVSCSELDLLVDYAREFGDGSEVVGSRMTGGGFGGCTVSLVKRASVETFIDAIATRYERATGIRADSFATRPARGAHVVRG